MKMQKKDRINLVIAARNTEIFFLKEKEFNGLLSFICLFKAANKDANLFGSKAMLQVFVNSLLVKVGLN